jgi:menaquinone-dependent protoporphyrinogen oxidase
MNIMKVLVTAASRHGATAEIARRIGETLSAAGLEVDLRQPDDVDTIAPYDGVVIGSAVYAGHWLRNAKDLIERETEALAARSVWLFSSGPLGDPLKPTSDPEGIARFAVTIHPIDHRVFAGKADRHELGMAERAIFAVVRAPEGDFRQWDAVTEWATGIAETLWATHVPELVQ